MTKINDILSIKIEDDIKSVIDLNQQEDQDISDELDGFILTESLAKHLLDFCDYFQSNPINPGIWLSGFYGSGKSYFTKMIGFLLKNPTINGTPFRERFANKLVGLPNADLLMNSINELGRSNNHVVLFDSDKATGNHGISYMMMSAFLKSLKLNDDWIGIIEYNLLLSDRYQQFCDKVQQKFGDTWINIRKNMDLVYDTLEETMTDGFSSQSAFNDMRDAAKMRIADYDANKLKEDLERYLKKYDTRIIFMIDEVSMAILHKKINIADLQGMAEAMSSLKQSVWTISIAQQQLDDVINASNVSRSELTKIIDRFKKRINITAEEVNTIIRKRLLAKTSEGSVILQDYYKKNNGKIADITNIVGTGLNKTLDAQTYADYYPFYEHQFKMLQYFLFGTQKLVKTQVGTRGMLISAFDVLKKEAMAEKEIPSHVNASQLCRQAEEAVDESLRTRYDQADEHLSETPLTFVIGHELLQTIHFLTESGAKTTVENISRAYVNNPDDYFYVLAEVKKACSKLADDEILILSGDEYRITSETQKRIFEMMNSYEGIASFDIKREITSHVRQLGLVNNAGSISVDGNNISLSVASDSGEPLSNGGDQELKVIFHDILSVRPTFNEYVEHIKDETQSLKNTISIIPSIEHASVIQTLAECILRIKYIMDVPNLTAEEKNVVDEIKGSLENKEQQLEQAIVNSYVNGTLIYLYNSSILTEQNANQLLKDTELKMFNNIYTRRLSGTLKDSLALQILKANSSQLQSTIGQQTDFQFFDTSGQFIGEQLPVVTEIMALTAAYKNGAEIEQALSAAPTGYTYGTVISTLAALFRASKVIIKFNNQEFYSCQQDGSKEPFANSRNFQRASFKAVSKSLTYNQKRDIVDTLKYCKFKELTGKNLSYNMNDFELVDAIRILAEEEMGKVKNKILFNEELERLFKSSIAARDVLQHYAGAVTEANCFSRATTFLKDDNNEEFCKSVERIESDCKFIDNNLKYIEWQKEYFADVKNEMEFVGIPMQAYDAINERYFQMLEADPVHNYSQMQAEYQKLKDLYYQYMNARGQEMTNGYLDLNSRIEAIKNEVDKYDRSWNAKLYNKIEEKLRYCKKYVISKIELKDYDICCRNSKLQLRDIVNAINLLPAQNVDVDVMETEIVTTAPAPAPQPVPTPEQPSPTPLPQPSPQPTVRKLRNQLPTGQYTVAQYKEWLKQQLSMVNKYNTNDIIKFDE